MRSARIVLWRRLDSGGAAGGGRGGGGGADLAEDVVHEGRRSGRRERGRGRRGGRRSQGQRQGRGGKVRLARRVAVVGRDGRGAAHGLIAFQLPVRIVLVRHVHRVVGTSGRRRRCRRRHRHPRRRQIDRNVPFQHGGSGGRRKHCGSVASHEIGCQESGLLLPEGFVQQRWAAVAVIGPKLAILGQEIAGCGRRRSGRLLLLRLVMHPRQTGGAVHSQALVVGELEAAVGAGDGCLALDRHLSRRRGGSGGRSRRIAASRVLELLLSRLLLGRFLLRHDAGTRVGAVLAAILRLARRNGLHFRFDALSQTNKRSVGM